MFLFFSSELSKQKVQRVLDASKWKFFWCLPESFRLLVCETDTWNNRSCFIRKQIISNVFSSGMWVSYRPKYGYWWDGGTVPWQLHYYVQMDVTRVRHLQHHLSTTSAHGIFLALHKFFILHCVRNISRFLGKSFLSKFIMSSTVSYLIY